MSACLISLGQADGRRFLTAKQLAKSKTAAQVQKSFVDNFASQCGYCTPGFVAGIAACGSVAERKVELNGHICRCTGYFPIKNAAKEAPIVDIEELAQLCSNCPR